MTLGFILISDQVTCSRVSLVVVERQMYYLLGLGDKVRLGQIGNGVAADAGFGQGS